MSDTQLTAKQFQFLTMVQTVKRSWRIMPLTSHWIETRPSSAVIFSVLRAPLPWCTRQMLPLTSSLQRILNRHSKNGIDRKRPESHFKAFFYQWAVTLIDARLIATLSGSAVVTEKKTPIREIFAPLFLARQVFGCIAHNNLLLALRSYVRDVSRKKVFWAERRH